MIIKTKDEEKAYSPSKLNNAYMSVIENNTPVYKAARQFGVPLTTLRDRVDGRVSIDTVRSGPNPLFSLEQEAKLVIHIKFLAEVGYGYTRSEVIHLANDYAVHLRLRDANNPLSKKWIRGFYSRWPTMHSIQPSSLSAQRARCTTAVCIEKYFKDLNRIYVKYDLTDKPWAIYNVDEKGLNTEHKPPKVIAGADLKNVQAITSNRSAAITVLGCGNAAGSCIPPYFVFPGKRMMPNLLTGGSPGADGCKNGGQVVTRNDVCHLASKAYTQALSHNNIVSAFRKSGVYPLNPDVITERDTAPSLPYQGKLQEKQQQQALTDVQVHSNLDQASQFLVERGGEILQNVKIAKVRRNISKIIGGRAITEDEVFSNIKAFKDESERIKGKKNSSDEKRKLVKEKNDAGKGKAQTRKEKTYKRPASSVDNIHAQPGTSGVQSKKSKNQLIDSSSSSEDEVSDEEKCCKCGKFQPEELKHCVSIVFTKLAQCDNSACGHWTHLGQNAVKSMLYSV
ncbi:hypothetical protein KUTeg_016614 [Tegillarca granosa]|uniref:HTH CENPB-type domain-containing protein n=1 Tax=Tegillarca granosa TaxID=220873 RepID=A0ABQ9ELF8_TEGGR|nr:hypothetical protein KUTeg_016614 [Tegillarca granosa]